MRRTGLARGQGVEVAISSAPKARKVFVSHPRAGRRAVLAIQTAHSPCAKSPFWWVTFREQTWVTSRERRRRTHHARDATTNQRRVGRRTRDIPGAGRAGAAGVPQASGADRRRHRDGRICVYQRLLDRPVLPACGHPDEGRSGSAA